MFLVKLLLALVAGHSFLRYIELSASSRKWPGLPKPLPLGEVSLRSNDGEGKPAGGSRSGFPSYNLSVSLRSTAPLVGEPLAKPFTLRGLPKPLPLGEVALRSNDGEGKPGTKEYLRSDKHWLLIESSYRCVFVLSQHPCPLRRSAPAPPLGELSPKVTERARTARSIASCFPSAIIKFLPLRSSRPEGAFLFFLRRNTQKACVDCTTFRGYNESNKTTYERSFLCRKR